MRRSIPPLNPLRTFEAAARHRSFTRAAEELHVTQAAVSRQVATLEEYLGFKLFRRRNRDLEITDVGVRYAKAISKGFDVIESATDVLPIGRPHARSLNIRTYTTFAQCWLIPRLPRFVELHPNINLHLRTSVDEVDFDKDDVQLAIHYGRVRQSDVVVEPFLRDVIEPACSPTVAAKLGNPADLARLKDFPLLQTIHRGQDWSAWLRHAGQDHTNKQVLMFESSVLAYQAATEGLGFAMAQVALISKHIESGQLVLPFGKPLARPYSHQLVYRPASEHIPALRAFRNWIMAEAANAAASVQVGTTPSE
jgi:LysR family glycine cleavage system transcriptional activator